jgi:hypothetical protein
MNRASKAFLLLCCFSLVILLVISGCHQADYTPPIIINLDQRITVLPTVDDPEGDIRFLNVIVTTGTLPDGYYSPLQAVPNHPGDPCFIISGQIRNSSSTGYYVAYHAEGFDVESNEVSFTLDMGPIAGIAQLFVDPGSTVDFTLHLSWSDNATSFTLHSQKSAHVFW